MFKDAGADPENIPTTWDELYALAPKLTSGQSVSVRGARGSRRPAGRASCTSSSTTTRSPTRSSCPTTSPRSAFNNDAGLKTFQAIDRGFKAKFFDPAGVTLQNDYASGLVFNAGDSASQINYSELWGQAVSGNVKDFKATIDPAVVGASVMPGVEAGTHGGSNGFEGFGISKFSKQKEAAASFIQTVSPGSTSRRP